MKPKAHEIAQAIDFLGKQIDQKISQELYDIADELVAKRLALIAELISAATDENHQTLLNYLRDIQEHNSKCIARICEEKQNLERGLSKLSKVEEYLL